MTAPNLVVSIQGRLTFYRVPDGAGRRLLQLAVVVVLLITGWGVGFFEGRFKLGIDAQVISCLPGHHHLFAIDRWDRIVQRGNIYAFTVKGIEPYYKDGTILAKLALGLPGDVVHVSRDTTTINGSPVAEHLYVAQQKGWGLEKFERDLTVPPHFVFMVGTTEFSFDSRYWGPVSTDFVVGRVHVLW